MSRRPVIPRDCGLWSHGNSCCIGTTRTKGVVSGPKPQKLLQAAQDLFDGLQSTWAHHMVSKVHGLTTMVSKMQKLCIWAEMYQNDGLRAIYPAERRARFREKVSEKVSSAVCFLQQSDCVAEKMKTIDFILDGKFHLHTPKKRRV